MAAKAEAYLSEVLEAFDFGAVVVGAVRFGQGHINDTFVVHTQPENECCRRYILQRMSSAAFKRPDQLMENIIGVTEYLGREVEKTGGSREREAMRVIRPRSGEPYYTDSDGGAWRGRAAEQSFSRAIMKSISARHSAARPSLSAATAAFSLASLFEAYTQAFLEGAGGTLTEKEIEYLPWGAKLMTLECGMRFLTDYLEGDVYFHISRERQNLDRCRTQPGMLHCQLREVLLFSLRKPPGLLHKPTVSS